MLRSMTGFGRCFLEDVHGTQVWEVRSVNSRYLELRWRLPVQARSFETMLEKVVRRHASRGRVEISLVLQPGALNRPEVAFQEDQADAMLESVAALAASRGDAFTPDYTRLLGLGFLWGENGSETDDALGESLEKGLTMALEDWNESRVLEGRALEKDVLTRILRMEEWLERIRERAPDIKEERFATVRERLSELLERHGQELEEGRFLQEIALMADRLDVSEELTRLGTHLERLRELFATGKDAGRKLDFTMQECFREITTCGNKIQDAQVSRLIVDMKNELEKCREQVQNVE